MIRLIKSVRNWLFKPPEPLNAIARRWLRGELGRTLK